MEKNLDIAAVHEKKVILKEVQYGAKSVVDDKSSSHVFYEVQKDTACGTLKKGDLIKVSTRIFQTVELDGETYYYTNTEEYILIIPKESINADRLKR